MSVRDRVDMPEAIKEKYFVDRKLGSGAFGEVFKLLDKRLQPYAVKHIKGFSSSASGSMSNKSTTNEINILKNLSHPCIIKFVDIIRHGDGGASIILEFMAGGDLLNRIVNHPLKRLTEDQARGMFYQLTHALQYLHQKGITHRDIKPDNVLLLDNSDDTLVKLSDFGLSKVVTDGTVLKSLLGTPNYVAPEIINTTKLKEYNNKVDIWSMGVMLFAMLSGTLPFAEDYGDIQAQILKGKFNFSANCWQQVSSDAKEMIKRMLTVNPQKRISISEIFASSWLSEKHTSVKAAIELITSQGIVLLSQEKSTSSLLTLKCFLTTLSTNQTTENKINKSRSINAST